MNLLRRNELTWTTLIAVVVFLAATLVVGGDPVDDAGITYRFARNLAHGHGLCFNPGTRVEGYVHFSWIVLLAGVEHLTGLEPMTAGPMLGRIFGALAVLWTGWIARRLVLDPRLVWRPRRALCAAAAPLLLATNLYFVLWSTAGLETPLFTWLLLVVVHGTLRGGRTAIVAVPLVSVGLCMTRPEGVLVVAALALHAVLDRPRPPGRTLVVTALLFLGPAGIYFLWRWTYFGHLLPNVFYAKAALPWEAGLLYLQAFLLRAEPRILLPEAIRYAVAALTLGPVLLALPGLLGRGSGENDSRDSQKNTAHDRNVGQGATGASIASYQAKPRHDVPPRARREERGDGRPPHPGDGPRRPWGKPPARALVMVLALWVAGVLYERGDWMGGFRFFVPVLPVMALLAAAAALWLTGRGRAGRMLGATLLASSLAFNLTNGFLYAREPVTSPHRTWFHQRAYYDDMAAWVQAHVPPGARLALGDMGYIPYATLDRHYVDFLGLVDEKVSHLPGGILNPELWTYLHAQRLDYFISIVHHRPDGTCFGHTPVDDVMLRFDRPDLPADERIFVRENTVVPGWREKGDTVSFYVYRRVR